MTDDKHYERMVLIRKVIMIVVTSLLILWSIFFLYVSKNSIKQDVIDEKYEANIKAMEHASKAYFTKDILKDDITIISLKNMYEKKLLNKLTTSSKEECVDIASYAKVTRLEDKYKLDVVLVCGNNNSTKTTYYDLACGLSCDEIKTADNNK